MRDTLVAILVICGIVGGFYASRLTETAKPQEIVLEAKNLPSTGNDAIAVQKTSDQRVEVRRGGKSQKGVRHGKRTNKKHYQQVKAQREDEGAANNVVTAESVPSIYSEEQQPSGSAALNSSNGGVSATTAPKVVHGVPVEGWVRSHRNSLSPATVTDETGEGMRLFVQCVEVKKRGTTPLSERQCGALSSNESMFYTNYH